MIDTDGSKHELGPVSLQEKGAIKDAGVEGTEVQKEWVNIGYWRTR